MTYPQWLQETIATEIDENGEISDATKEAIAAEADAHYEATLAQVKEFCTDNGLPALYN